MLEITLREKYKQANKNMFNASIFGKVNSWKQMSMNKGMHNKMFHANMMEHYTATNKNSV